MITNERQCKITRKAAKIKAGIDEFDEVASLKSGVIRDRESTAGLSLEPP